MRLTAAGARSTHSLRRRGRYLLLAGALLAAGAGWLAHRGTPATETGQADASHAARPAAWLDRLGQTSGLTSTDACLHPAAGTQAPSPPARLSGRLGLYVAVVDPVTLEPLRATSHDPDGVFPLASAYKQAVLWALLKQRDDGTLKLSETFSVNSGTQSLGNYPYDHSDVTALAKRMIHNSDNTATDLLHRRVGLQAVQDVADGLRLCNTRLILPTKDWWTAQAGLSPSFPGADRFAALHGQGRLLAAQALDADTRQNRPDLLQHRLDDYFDHRYSARTDLGTQNVSTPAEFAHLVAAEFLRSGLSQSSQQVQRDIMATGFGRSRLHVPLTVFGGKGGNGWRMLSFSGYLHTAGGEDVVYAFMQHGADQEYTMPNTGAAFAWINAAMKTVLLEGDGGDATQSGNVTRGVKPAPASADPATVDPATLAPAAQAVISGTARTP
ncbi:serine hydrolase [Deinococcus radiomollis]|uniref:serine hydrolase n=1 Tax=Deinococcus radiomollis TaxID=468916 RepID=UPI0038928D4B